jgi:4-oxalocrotonate tautomerase
MPIIHISIAKGRSLDQKRTLARKLTEVTAETLGVSPEKIWIRIDEFEKENFSVNGELMCDRG